MSVHRVYIQVGDDDVPVGPCGFALWEGARFLGFNPVSFQGARLPRFGNLTRSTLVHGWVSTVHAALGELGVPIPAPLDYPKELAPWFGRGINPSTLGAVHESFVAIEIPRFIKPVACKQFTGHTIETFSDLAETANLPPETPVWVSDVVDFVSEYRCFVHARSLVGVQRYYGDAWTLPDKPSVLAMIRSFESGPAGYALDVGVTRDGRTLLVEANDGYALGNQGLAPLPYTELVIARWEQMVGSP